MSHVATDEIKAEPNLVPLLDLVFQLIMFFMICVNFVSEQVSADIVLPIAQSARAMDKGEIEVLVLNMDAKGDVTVVGQQQPLKTAGQKISFLRNYYQDAKRAAQAIDAKGDVKTTVIIRADARVNYEQLYELMGQVKEAKFKKMQLRAY